MMSTATIDSPAAYEEYLGGLASGDITGLQAALADKGPTGFMGRLKGYTDHMREQAAKPGTTAAELDAQIREQAQLVLAEMIKDDKTARRLNLNPVDTRAAASRPGHGHNPRARGAAADGMFGSMGEFVQDLWHHQSKYGAPSAEQHKRFSAYSEKVPAEGGFLVPEEFRADLLRMSLENSVVRPRARVVPMGSLELSFPAIDDTSHASSLFGGVIVYRTEEAAALTASNAQLRRVKLTATKQTALANISNEVIKDTAGAVETVVRELVPEAIAFAEDDDYLTGTGAGEPLGHILPGQPHVIAVAKRTGQDADTIVWENIVDMYARLLPASIGRSVWVITPDAFPQLATMGLVVGTGGGPIWLPDGTGAPTMTLLGRPIVVTEKAPAVLGDVGDISLVDFGYYLIGDRQGLEITSSEHSLFSSDQTQLRFIQRNDGQPWIISPLTPKNGGPTLSAVVQLATRS